MHRGNVYPGQHKSIIPDDLWHLVQTKLADNQHDRKVGAYAENPSLLAGLIFDARGRPLTPTHANKQDRRYRYYVSNALLKGDESKSENTFRLPPGDVEAVVFDRLNSFFISRSEVSAAMEPYNLSAQHLENVLTSTSQWAEKWASMTPRERAERVRALVQRVTIDASEINIEVTACQVIGTQRILNAGDGSLAPILVSVAAELKRCGKGKRIVIHNGTPTEINPGLVRLLQQAFRARELLLVDTDESLNGIEARLRKSKGHMTSLMRLSYLSPAIIQDI